MMLFLDDNIMIGAITADTISEHYHRSATEHETPPANPAYSRQRPQATPTRY